MIQIVIFVSFAGTERIDSPIVSEVTPITEFHSYSRLFSKERRLIDKTLMQRMKTIPLFQLLSLLISEHEYQVVELHTICHELEASVYRASRTSTAGCCASLSTTYDLNLRV